MKKYINFFFITLITVLLSCFILVISKAISPASYINPAYLTKLSFGSHSHWIQPWRAYLETLPAKDFLDGIGIVWNVQNSIDNPEPIAQMLAKYGFTRVRVEIGWNHLDFEDETKLISRSEAKFQRILLALQKNNIRPLILLNSHHSQPCPAQNIQYTLTSDAHIGDRTLYLDNVRDLRVNYSGLSKVNQNSWGAEYLITDIVDNIVVLSKPLPRNIKAGESILITTLKYRPFSIPGSEDYLETIAGWKQYLATVTQFVTNTLETSESNDKGFDLEIWNELTFGSNFLYVNKYYEPNLYQYEEESIWQNLIAETASYVDAHPNDFSGVSIGNGFSNTIPWSASSEQPLRINALCKHPYKNRVFYPQDERRGKSLNAIFQETNFIPSYSAFFPEYIATALQTETIVRDTAPITSQIYTREHGRYARVVEDKAIPTPVWITEVNSNLEQDNPRISVERALQIKAKAIARYFCFYLNKGVTQLYLYAVGGGDKRLGVLQDNFLEYAKESNATYLLNDDSYVSPALKVVSRIVNKMSQELDSSLTQTNPLELISIQDRHNNYQFQGDGSKEHPDLRDRDVFTFLPFQVNNRKYIIPYYVMTRDIMEDLSPEEFIIEIAAKQLDGKISVEVYDPLKDIAIPVQSDRTKNGNLSLKISATDYPYLLTIEGK